VQKQHLEFVWDIIVSAMDSKSETLRNKPRKKAFTEGDHFYYNEEGLMVLTALYLKNRGYCCKNKCKHCPYETAHSS
tara:strand:+ start:574 stop:804 length:231 start_codon:yes stop_codon:yes gene_type:complete